MAEFEIRSERELSATFHSPQINANGWLEFYSLTISGRDMQATIRVENSPYGTNPVDFFETLSNEWQGWENDKEWYSIEGEFSLFAKSDKTGHIELSIKAQPHSYAPCWSSEVVLVIEAGQLDRIASQARSFFNLASNSTLQPTLNSVASPRDSGG